GAGGGGVGGVGGGGGGSWGAASRKFDAFRLDAFVALAAWATDELAEARSIIAAPGVGPVGTWSYGNGCLAVVGASGSLTSRRSWKTFIPLLAPNFASRPARKFEFVTSPPPPLPKIEPISANPAIAFVTVRCGT